MIIPTLEIRAGETIYTCAGYEDQVLTLETGEEVTFVASGLDVELPKRDNSGNQSLKFAIENVTGIAQRIIDERVKSGGKTLVIYRAYLASDRSAPSEPPIVLTMEGAQFNGGTAQVTCSFQSPINAAWPKKRYTSEFAPGLVYFT